MLDVTLAGVATPLTSDQGTHRGVPLVRLGTGGATMVSMSSTTSDLVAGTWRGWACASHEERTPPPGLGRHLAAAVVAGAAGTVAMDLMLYQRYRRDGGEDPLLQSRGRRDDLGRGIQPRAGRAEAGTSRHTAATTRQLGPDRDQGPSSTGLRASVGASSTASWQGHAAAAAGIRWSVGLALGPVAAPATRCSAGGRACTARSGKYARTLGEDLSAHLVFGGVTAAVFAALAREDHDQRHLRCPETAHEQDLLGQTVVLIGGSWG